MYLRIDDLRGIPSNRRDVDHAITELDERTPHHGQLQLGDVPQAKLGELLVFFFAQPSDEALRSQLLTILECRQSILGKYVVEFLSEVRCRDLELFAHLFQVAATDNADDALLAERGEQRVEFGEDRLTGKRERSVDVEQADGSRVLAVRVIRCHFARCDGGSWRGRGRLVVGVVFDGEKTGKMEASTFKACCLSVRALRVHSESKKRIRHAPRSAR